MRWSSMWSTFRYESTKKNSVQLNQKPMVYEQKNSKGSNSEWAGNI